MTKKSLALWSSVFSQMKPSRCSPGHGPNQKMIWRGRGRNWLEHLAMIMNIDDGEITIAR
jgi:hypothetical protein